MLFGYKNLMNYCYASLNDANETKTSGIFRMADGNLRELADITVPITPGEFHAIGIEVTGSTVRVSLDGSPVATADARKCFGGLRRVGFGARNDAAHFDDLKVTR